MGLGDLIPDEDSSDSSSSNNQSSSSSGSGSDESSGGGYPKFREKVPYFAIWKDESGEFGAAASPHSHTVQEIKESKGSKWRVRMIPDELERYWMDRTEYLRTAQIVEKVLDMDLMELLQNDPASANRAIIFASKHYHSDQTPSRVRRCGVCNCDLNIIEDQYEKVGNRIICPDHTVQELKKHNLL